MPSEVASMKVYISRPQVEEVISPCRSPFLANISHSLAHRRDGLESRPLSLRAIQNEHLLITELSVMTSITMTQLPHFGLHFWCHRHASKRHVIGGWSLLLAPMANSAVCQATRLGWQAFICCGGNTIVIDNPLSGQCS